MRTSHVVLAAASVILAGVLAWDLRQHTTHVRAATLQGVPVSPLIPVAEADMPAGLDGTVQELSDLLQAGDAEQALRRCWAPSNLEQMNRCGLFAKCAQSLKENVKLPPTLNRMLAIGPTKTFKTPEGFYYADFDENTAELTSVRFVYACNHWYVW